MIRILSLFRKGNRSPIKGSLYLAFFFSFWLLYFYFFWARAFTYDDSGNLIAGHVNLWGDWGAHITMATAMAYRHLFLFESPLLIGAPFAYPFLANQLSAVLLRLGVSFVPSFVVPSFILSLGLVIAIYAILKTFFRDRAVAAAGSTIFLLNGGWGFLRFMSDVAKSATPLVTLLNPPVIYTRLDEWNVRWVNMLEGYFIPQRGLQLGLPLALAAVAVIYREMIENAFARTAGESPRRGRLFLVGVVFGLFPIIHTHAFVAMGVIFGCWCLSDFAHDRGRFLRERWKSWAFLFLPAVAVALPLIKIWFLHQISGPGFFRVVPGWYAGELHINWLWFWFVNWGPTLPLAAAGFWLLMRGRSREDQLRTVVVFAPFLLLFALANIFVFQPWIWDNSKIILWSSVGISGLAANAIVFVYRGSPARRVVAAVLFLITIATGFVDVFRTLRPALNQQQMYTAEEMDLARWTRANTPADAIFLAGSNHNNWVFNLTGRQVLMTYEGWLWSHGYESDPVRRDVYRMLSDPKRIDLFQKYHVDYASIGPYEINEMHANKEAFEKIFPAVHRSSEYTVYATSENILRSDRVQKAIEPVNLKSSINPGRNMRSGLLQRVYRGEKWTGEPIFSEAGSKTIGFFYNVDQPRPFPEVFSATWEGYLDVPNDGVYAFRLESDDGSWLIVDGVEIINNGDNHAVRSEPGWARLSMGFHSIQIKYFDAGLDAALRVHWTPPGEPEQPLDPNRLFYRPQ